MYYIYIYKSGLVLITQAPEVRNIYLFIIASIIYLFQLYLCGNGLTTRSNTTFISYGSKHHYQWKENLN